MPRGAEMRAGLVEGNGICRSPMQLEILQRMVSSSRFPHRLGPCLLLLGRKMAYGPQTQAAA